MVAAGGGGEGLGMARPEGEHFKQKSSEPAGLFPRMTDASVTRLVSQEGVARPWSRDATRGCRATNHGKRHEDFIPSAMEDISGIPGSYHFSLMPQGLCMGCLLCQEHAVLPACLQPLQSIIRTTWDPRLQIQIPGPWTCCTRLLSGVPSHLHFNRCPRKCV